MIENNIFKKIGHFFKRIWLWIKGKWRWLIGLLIPVALAAGLGGGLVPVNNDITSSSNPVIEPIIEPTITPPRYSLDFLPTTQIEDEFFEKKEGYTFNRKGDKLLYSEILYPTKKTRFGGTLNLINHKALKVNKVPDYISDKGKPSVFRVGIEDTKLDIVNVMTLYVRAKKIETDDRTLTAKVVMGNNDKPITLFWSKEDLERGWWTKWGSASGKWTPGQISNAHIELITTGEGGEIEISSVRLYVGRGYSLVDNFDLYNDGDLCGQGTWTLDKGVNDTYQVQNSVAHSGKAAEIDAGGRATNQRAVATFTEEADGKQALYFRYDTNGAKGAIWIGNSDDLMKVAIRLNNTADELEYYNGSTYEDVATGLSADTWYKSEIEWRASDNKARYRIDDGTWTDWDTANGAWTSLDRITLFGYKDASAVWWVDEFSDPNAAPPPAAEEFIPPIIIE